MFALGCVFMEMLAVIAGISPENLQQQLQEAKSSGLFHYKRQALQPGAGFCYSSVISGAEPFFKSLTTFPQDSPWFIRSGNGIVFFKKVIAPMVRIDRKRRPSALEVAAAIAEANMSPLCECEHAYLPKPKETLDPSAAIQSLVINKVVPKAICPPIFAPANSAIPTEQLHAFKDYYSNDEIQVRDYVSVLWKYEPRAGDEFALERGEMLLIISIWNDGWSTAAKTTTRAEEFDPTLQRKRNDSLPTEEVKAFPLVCVCLPQHWRKTIEGDKYASET
jgi:hypothetical protein